MFYYQTDFPFKQLPVLYIDDNPPLAQSGAIEKYLASIYGLNGGNELEAAYIEMMTSQINDVTLSQLPFFEKDVKIKVIKSFSTPKTLCKFSFKSIITKKDTIYYKCYKRKVLRAPGP